MDARRPDHPAGGRWGIGKTTLWCNIITAISSGKTCLLDPEGHTRKPARVAFFTTEDSVRKKLKRKLRMAGADMKISSPRISWPTKPGCWRNLEVQLPGDGTLCQAFQAPALRV